MFRYNRIFCSQICGSQIFLFPTFPCHQPRPHPPPPPSPLSKFSKHTLYCHEYTPVMQYVVEYDPKIIRDVGNFRQKRGKNNHKGRILTHFCCLLFKNRTFHAVFPRVSHFSNFSLFPSTRCSILIFTHLVD